jgi:methionyl-tRNA formyltransferase
MRVLFIGTGDIGVAALEWLLRCGKHQLAGVVTQPDKPVGRKQLLTPPKVKVIAQAADVPVLQPEKIRRAVDELAALQPDIAVVVAYGQILSRAVLEVPKHGCLNIHTSLLPLYRGAAPIQAAIREGDAETGITIMFMDEGLDTGDILLTEPVPITPKETGGSLHDKLALLAPGALERALDLIAAGNPPRIPQDNSRATHIGKLTREHGHIDWSKSAAEIERTIRAYNPWPGTFCLLPCEGDTQPHLKIHAARMVAGEACPIGGTVVAGDPKQGLIIACGVGLLELTDVQVEGGKRMDARSLLRGHNIPVGTLLC